MAITKTTKAMAKKAAPAKKVATVTPIKAAKSAKATPAKAAKSAATQAKPEKTRVLASDLRAALLAGLSHTAEDGDDKQYAAVRLTITEQGLLRVNATDKTSAIRVVPMGAVSVPGKAFVAVIPASMIEDELAKPLRAQKDKRVDIWVGPKSGKPTFFVALDNGKQISVRLADWTYPDVDKLFDDMPTKCSLNAPIKVDGDRLSLFADAVAEFVNADAPVRASIRMLFSGPDKAVWLEAALGVQAEIVGLLMPIKDNATNGKAAAPEDSTVKSAAVAESVPATP